MDKLIEFKRKSLDFIDSQTMKEYLNKKDNIRFSLKELMSIVYHSERPKNEKISFYKDIKANFKLNDEEIKHINRLISGSKDLEQAMFSLKDGELIENIDYNKYPENLYVYVPNPFRVGDVVRLYNKKNEYVVINPNLPTGELALKSDWIDMCITVVPAEYRNSVSSEISIHHEHLYIFSIELVK